MSDIVYDSDLDKSQSVVVRVEREGSGYFILVHNRGHNVVEIRRLQVRRTLPGQGPGEFILRPPGEQGEPWEYESAYLPPGLGRVFHRETSVPEGTTVEAQAEFIEFAGRSRSSTFVA